jgi:hypothetical protein
MRVNLNGLGHRRIGSTNLKRKETMRDLEHLHAAALIRWWALFSSSHEIDERLLFAIPNGGHRHISVAKKMKEEGVRAGIPDYFLAIPRINESGLFIELKHPKGKLSTSQKEMISILKDVGYHCVVAFGWDEARTAIEKWIVGSDTNETS